MDALSNKIFFGCNYNDKKIKSQFDQLKVRLELDFPVVCVIIDKRANKPAKDLWLDIQNEIRSSSACIFDVTGFRPNVVLELGFSFALKNNEQIFITFRRRKSKGKVPDWLLSDIQHLNYNPYKNVRELETFCRDQIEKTQFMQNLKSFKTSCEKTGSPIKYYDYGLKVLKTIRDEGEKFEQQIKTIIEGSNCRVTQMITLLKQNSLLKKEKGKNRPYKIF